MGNHLVSGLLQRPYEIKSLLASVPIRLILSAWVYFFDHRPHFFEMTEKNSQSGHNV